MIEIAKLFIEFMIIFLIVYLIFYIFSYRKLGKYNRKKMPLGINYLVVKYKLDIVRLGFKKVSKTLLWCDSFIITFMFAITKFIDNVYIRLLVAFILIFPTFAGVYHLVAMYYEKESE